jgi:hypothetical protein
MEENFYNVGIPDDLLSPYGPIWPVAPAQDLYEWDSRYGAAPDDIADYIAECAADEWKLIS